MLIIKIQIVISYSSQFFFLILDSSWDWKILQKIQNPCKKNIFFVDKIVCVKPNVWRITVIDGNPTEECGEKKNKELRKEERGKKPAVEQTNNCNT